MRFWVYIKIMKVKINYTVDLEAVPSEVDKLFGETQALLRELEFLSETVAPTVEAPLSTVKTLDQMRRLLYDLDLALQDCQTIMIDYQTTIAAESAKDLHTTEGDENGSW